MSKNKKNRTDKKPLTSDDALAERRKRMVTYAADNFDMNLRDKGSFTCDDCSLKNDCHYVYDLYNTNGDCLAEK